MKSKLLILLTTIFLVVLISLTIYLLTFQPPQDAKSDNLIVSRVIDGDTFTLSNNQTVRLICVDTPEKGKTGYQEAKDYLSGMILDKEVRLEKDVSETDEYGRLLRYVYVNISGVEFFVNQQIVQEGYGSLFVYENDTERCDEISG